jgi:hypothetical protein
MSSYNPGLTMPKRKSKSKWTAVKTRLAEIDRLGLLDLIHDLYALNKDNQIFLHTRFNQSDDALVPYKRTLRRWLSPNVLANQDVSVTTAKQAIAEYRKALGDPAGLAELMVFYCECAAGFCVDVGMNDAGYLGALLRMFDQALKVSQELPEAARAEIIARLEAVCSFCNIGYGIKETMGDLLAEHSDA